MNTFEWIGILLVIFGLIYIILLAFGKISDKTSTLETQILKVKGGTGVILIALGIFILVVGGPSASPSDFNISINPVQGAVQQGGSITTTININDIHGYEQPVSLSATGQPSGVVIAFVPPFGEAKPFYISIVTINVDQNVPAGDYPIRFKGTGADRKEHTCSYTLTVKPSIIDSMESTMGWYTYKDSKGSSINIKSIAGRTDNGIEISYELKEEGWISMNKKINPEILSEYEGLRFYYKGSGRPNTIEIQLGYEDSTHFSVVWHRATVADDWVSVELPYSDFNCWYYNRDELDLEKVREIQFFISNNPNHGDVYGSGWVIIDDVQGIAS